MPNLLETNFPEMPFDSRIFLIERPTFKVSLTSTCWLFANFLDAIIL